MLAEAYVAEGQLEAAVQQLTIAVKSDDKTDFYLTSRIESRLNELETDRGRTEKRKEMIPVGKVDAKQRLERELQ